MRKNLYYTSSDNVTTIHAIEWIPETEIKAVLQISHGMVEYIGRYDRFANYLNEYGIYVVGNDHLGHGESVTSDDKHGFFKHPDGNECVIKDLHKLRKRTEKKYPDVTYFMLGHSMGSFLIREYMMVYGQGLAGVIVMGTGSQPNSVLVLGKIICKIMASFKGWEYRSKLIDRMVFSGNNKKFEPARTPQDWLTKDEKIVNAYRENPWCTFTFTLNGFYQLFRTIQFVQKKENIQKISKELPIFLVAGCEDPVGSFGKGVKKVYKSYVDAGIKDVKIKLYENERHEILNETDYMVVYEDLRKWMEK